MISSSLTLSNWLFALSLKENMKKRNARKIEQRLQIKTTPLKCYMVRESYHHSHNGGGSFKSMGNPRRTIPKNDAGVGTSGAGTATETVLSDLAEGPPSQLMSLRTPVCRNSPSTRRPEGELQRSDGALRSSDKAVAGAGKLVLALAPLRDLAAPS